MKRGFLAALAVGATLSIGGTAAATEVPEQYTVAIEFFPEGGGPSVGAVFKCRRAEVCRHSFEVPIDGQERTLLFSGRVRGSELLELELLPIGGGMRGIEAVSLQKAFEPRMAIEQQVVRVRREPTGKKIGALPELKRVEYSQGRIRFTVSSG